MESPPFTYCGTNLDGLLWRRSWGKVMKLPNGGCSQIPFFDTEQFHVAKNILAFGRFHIQHFIALGKPLPLFAFDELKVTP
jgi:hypothetical protein